VLAALRRGAVDLYYHSVRLIVANLIWGAAFVAFFGLWGGVGPIALFLAPLVAIPWVGLVRLAALVARGGDPPLGEAFRAYSRWLIPTLVAGLTFVAAAFVLLTNVSVGVQFRGIAGSAFAMLSVWGLVTAWLIALAFWPLLVDPSRSETGAAAKLRLAAIVVIAYPVRTLLLGAVLAAIAFVSIAAVLPIVTVSAGYVAATSCRFVFAAADRLEGRRIEGADEDADPEDDEA
jgi:uncharacterized membrane protein YesL